MENMFSMYSIDTCAKIGQDRLSAFQEIREQTMDFKAQSGRNIYQFIHNWQNNWFYMDKSIKNTYLFLRGFSFFWSTDIYIKIQKTEILLEFFKQKILSILRFRFL